MAHIEPLKAKIESAARTMRARLGDRKPEIGMILGSGLNSFAEEIEDAETIAYEGVPYMYKSTCTGHEGRFVCGTVEGKCVLAMQGRLHGYEGCNAQEVAFPVWLMNELGIKTLITTNAAGAINPDYRVGDFCIMSDHINFTGRNPVAECDTNEIAFRFFSMKDAYAPELRAIAHEVADEQGVGIQEGVYLGLLGPSFETPAEIRAFRIWGADTVAMSVCEEVIAARHVGMRVLGISLISNMACGVGDAEIKDITDSEVFQVAKEVEPKFCALAKGIIAKL